MGQFDEEDRPFLFIDKDTGRVYDLRDENSIKRLTSRQTRLTSDASISSSSEVAKQPSSVSGSSQKAWGGYWEQRKRNN